MPSFPLCRSTGQKRKSDSESVSIIYVNILITIVAEHVNANKITIIVRFYTKLKQTVLNSWHVKPMSVRREGETGIFPWKWD